MAFMEMNDLSTEGIHPSLLDMAFPVDKCGLLPGNPRKGNVDAVVASFNEFGQRTPIVGRENPSGDGVVILAGNTRLQAARRLGWSHIAVMLVDDDDDKAAAYAIADNRSHDLGEYDDEALLKMVNEFRHDDDLLAATMYDLFDVAAMEDKLDGLVAAANDDTFEIPDFHDEEEAPPPERPTPQPVISATIVFEDEEQQATWHRFVRWLKGQYPDEATLGGRIDVYINGLDLN